MTDEEFKYLRGMQLSAQLMHGSEFDPNKYSRETYLCSYKLDGLRAVYCPATKTFYSRQGLPWHQRMVSHIRIGDVKHALDGEFYAHGLKLQDINSAMAISRSHPTEMTNKIKFHVFDVIGMGKNANDRLITLEHWRDMGHFVAGVELVRQCQKNCMNTMAGMMKTAIVLEYEGLMLKTLHGSYASGRSKNILKWKAYTEVTATVCGVKKGVGKFEGILGSLQLKTPTKIEFSCGTGWTDEERKEIWDHQHEYIGRKCVIRYLNLSNDGKPKIGSFIKWEQT